MPSIPKKHFDEDVERALALAGLADTLPQDTPAKRLLHDDVLRSAWMFSVGALDAYFCDAYIALVAPTLRAKSIQSTITLPDFIGRIEIPIGSVLADYQYTNWRWRMAIRKMMERDNVLSLETVKKLFNPFFPNGQKLFGEVIGDWAQKPGATNRVLGQPAAALAALAGPAKATAVKEAKDAVIKRFRELIQRRHDCIHNCDRPKVAPQAVHSSGTVRNVANDVRWLVEQADAHIDHQYGLFLRRIGCDAITRNALGY